MYVLTCMLMKTVNILFLLLSLLIYKNNIIIGINVSFLNPVGFPPSTCQQIVSENGKNGLNSSLKLQFGILSMYPVGLP